MEGVFSTSNLVSAAIWFAVFGAMNVVFRRIKWDQKKYYDEHPLKEMEFAENGAVKRKSEETREANS
jgi:hypothetical protein